MSMEKFDKLVKQRSELQSWWSMQNMVDSQDGSHYSLRVDFTKPSMVAFCGQAYAGSKNYHDAPAFFVDEIVKVVASKKSEITSQAYHNVINQLNAEIASLRESVMDELNKEVTP